MLPLAPLLCAASLVKSPLQRALSAPRAVLVDIAQDPRLAPPSAFDLEELSTRCRDAGAAALVVPSDLLAAFAAEQATAASSYPGPLPLICQLQPSVGGGGSEAAGEAPQPLAEPSSLKLGELRALGAEGVMVRSSALEGGAALADLVSAAEAEALRVVVLAGRAGEADAVAGAGAVAVVCEGDACEEGAPAASAASAASPPPARFGSWWSGDAESLAALREAGLERVYLEDACDGDLVQGAGRCCALIAAARSKQSRQWSGSMFGVSGDAPPERRNPLAWAQSKRQAREIMHDSASSRGLPPPKLRK